ncbi:HD-GYP domain-containing protein [Streptomyces sp. NPDC052396]|uniref:HD-GYP domain-containing protein n=1 Tax=Streptomyces sp. NPDC052396 TaxID=3365689 RepID=UPI0037CE621E
MSPPPGPARWVHAAAGACALPALAWTAWHGLAQPRVALAYGLLIALGEAVRRRPPAGDAPGAGREVAGTAPVSAAGSIAYALLDGVGGDPATQGVPQVVAVVLGATLAGAAGRPAATRRGRRHPPARSIAADRLARRVLHSAFAALCCQALHHLGALAHRPGYGPYHAPALLLLLALTMLCDALLAAALDRSRRGGGYAAALGERLRALPGIGIAVCATAVVTALAPGVAGLWALPVCALPLLVIQLSARLGEPAPATRRQTVTSLARATEIAGCTPAGHAGRVAALSRAVGRELGLSQGELTVVEYAALMHDVGQLSLVDPVPAGATEPLPAEERRRIARLSGAVVRQTGVPAEVAQVVEHQADPYREAPLAARIVRTVNAYEDLAATGACGPRRALERLRRATAYDHEPRVVEALARVLARGEPELRECFPH